MLRVVSALKRFEFVLVVFLFAGAAWLRFHDLASVPGGFHGDEAVAGLEAQRILKEGSIGPYSPAALGQPAGPLYLTALSVRLFGPTIWAVRAVSALLGTLTVMLLYFLLRRHQGRAVALVGATLLATLNWHIHFSRIGFPVIAWPLCALAATFAVLEAVRREHILWWGFAGLLTGIGIYSYNAHVSFVAALGLWIVFFLAGKRNVSPCRRAGWLLSFAATLVFAAIPMARYASNPDNDYFSHARALSVFKAHDHDWLWWEARWNQQKDNGAKTRFFGERVIRFWDNLSFHSRVDAGDGTGIVPSVPLGVLVLAGVGLVLSLRNRRGALTGIGWCCVLLLPLGPILTVSGFTRRAFALAPFLSFLAAMGLVEIWKRTRRGKEQERDLLATGALALVVILLASQSLSDYFGKFSPAQERAFVFAQDYTQMCAFVQTLPPTSHVFLCSNRWSSHYEVRQFLAPEVQMEDRSNEFGDLDFVVKRGVAHPTFILMGEYLRFVPDLQKMYPHCRVQVGPLSVQSDKPAFVAVWPNGENEA